ncbi:hypothetical protein [Reichenbachiella versicolor]|uniref:hypothetical protein n=1 Tax=Reichenbachiella versicolor TaxID=1821036 RepID=UPI0013A59752|nr:hypothetical protein [Reichenbachiella versicolor]
MSDLEYDVLDELYLLKHFKDLITAVGLEEVDLYSVLDKLHKKEWIKCFEEPDIELTYEQVDLEIKFRKYFYQATKLGMKEHTV